jgi:hypothetical protein
MMTTGRNMSTTSVAATFARRVRRHSSHDESSERGAIMILALVYIIVISVVVAALTTWASGDLNSTNNFTSARSMDYSLSSAVEVAINDIRYTPLVGTNQTLNAAPPSYCWGTSSPSALQLPGTNEANIASWCSTLQDLGSATTRTVTISACLSSTSATTCAASPLLQAVVVFDDYPPGGSTAYTGACTTYCGEGALLESWDWSSKAGLSTPLPNSISVTSTPPQIPLVGGTYATASSATSGTVVVSSATSTICTVNASGVVSFVANGTCTIDFNDAGNANYSPAIQQVQTMTVGPLANAITVNSTPTSPTQGGATYATVSSATSGDTVVVTSATTGVCTVSAGIVTFVGNGTCTLNFNDPGDTDYKAATQVQQSFSVGVGSPAGLSVLGNASPQNGSPNNGDSVVYTYNQTMTASSLLSGFTGSSTPVFVQLTRSSSSTPTSWQVCSTSTCSTVVKLGTLNLGDGTNGYYMTSGSTVYFNATMLMSTNTSGESVVTVTLGSLVSGTVTTLSPTTSTTTLVWTPSASATSSFNGTACATTAVTEVNAPKANF